MISKAFLSYSWDDDAHKLWVIKLATRLRGGGVDLMLDLWHSAPGAQITSLVERSVRENDFVIAICTPRFKQMSDAGGGGIGYESDIVTAEAFKGDSRGKFIPVLRRGKWSESAPAWLAGRAYINLSGDPYSESEYDQLVRTLHRAGEKAPRSGDQQNFESGESPLADTNPDVVGLGVTRSTPLHQSSVSPTARRNGVRSGSSARRRHPEPLAEDLRPDARTSARATGLPSERILELAVELLKHPVQWLDHPNPHFGGRTPNELIAAGEEDRVYDLLRAAELGLY